MENLFDLPPELPPRELFESLVDRDRIRIERIVSTGQSTPPGQWYDQDRDEWVVLLQGNATLSYFDGSTVTLRSGDHLLIRAGQKHRVESTSTHPPCIWLAVHWVD